MAAPFVCAACKMEAQMPMKVCPRCGFNYANPQRSSGAKANLSNAGCLLFFPMWLIFFALLRFLPILSDLLGDFVGQANLTPSAILLGLAGSLIMLAILTQMASIAAHIPESWD